MEFAITKLNKEDIKIMKINSIKNVHYALIIYFW